MSANTKPPLYSLSGTERIQSPEMVAVVDLTRVDGARFDRLRGGPTGEHSKPDERSDCWGLGCLLFEIVVGDFLFDTAEWARFFMLLSDEKMGPLPEEDCVRKIEEVVGKEAGEIVVKMMRMCLSRERERRIAAAELAKRCDSICEDM